jgi:putative membrane protein
MLYILSLHIIFIVTWFAGLFYIVRLFVYHAETSAREETEKKILEQHFRIAEKRLWYGITWPSAILTLITGVWLVALMYGSTIPSWLWLKFGFVLGLIVYHLVCHKIFLRFQRNEIRYSGMQMRMWNEVATLFLVAIVFIVVTKDISQWARGLVIFILLAIALFVAIKVYKKLRKSDK